MSIVRTLQYTIWCDEDRCFFVPRTRTNYHVKTLKEALKAATRDGWIIKRNNRATCPACNAKTRGIG